MFARIRQLICLHTYELMGMQNIHRVVDSKVVGVRVVQRFSKCGHIHTTAVK